jgi:plastocyanin
MRTTAFVMMLILVGGCASTHKITPQVAGEGVDFSQATPVQVQLSSYKFTPPTVRLKVGRAYALKLVNEASQHHTFAAPEFFAAAKVASGDAAKIAKGEVELDPHQSVTVHLIASAGQYKLVCTMFGHALLGMKGTIKVE